METIYLLETGNGEFTAYKTIDTAKMALLRYYVNECLTNDWMSMPDSFETIKEDLDKILKYAYIEDCAWIHECTVME